MRVDVARTRTATVSGVASVCLSGAADHCRPAWSPVMSVHDHPVTSVIRRDHSLPSPPTAIIESSIPFGYLLDRCVVSCRDRKIQSDLQQNMVLSEAAANAIMHQDDIVKHSSLSLTKHRAARLHACWNTADTTDHTSRTGSTIILNLLGR
jgi:hypothetical protein